MANRKNAKQPLQKNDTTVHSKIEKKKGFLSVQVPLYVLVLVVVLTFFSVLFYFQYYTLTGTGTFSQNTESAEPLIKIARNNEQSLVHPLLFVDIENEKALNPVKTKINEYLEQKNREGALTSASVYLKDLSTGYCFNINADSLYDPASLMKVPLLMVCLKQAESNPALLKKSYRFMRNPANKTMITIKDKSLQEGRSYTVEQLLEYMIVYSDNEAFWMLSEYLDPKLLSDLDAKLDIPSNYDNIHYPARDKHIIANVKSVAHYFNVLYNGSYLNKSMSDYALGLLTKCTYKDGFTKQIEPGLLVAHKFGERTLSYKVGDRIENLLSEFHEFGIVYLGNRHYLLGVMTRGTESSQLQTIVSYISKIVYDELKA